MCGRFVLFTTGESLLEQAGSLIDAPVSAPAGTPPPRYNIAPTQTVAMLRTTGDQPETVLEPARWGLVPGWRKKVEGAPLFNARAETLAEKPSFRTAWKRGQRCVIPMDGYYEWKDKVPYFVTSAKGSMLWAAGLWDAGAETLSATIVTTASAGEIAWLHHRMPRMLNVDEARAWLTAEDPEDVAGLLEPRPMVVDTRAVRKEVGNARNEGEWLLEDAG